MKEEYVPYEIAVALKAAGFDWECDHYYTYGYVNDDPDDLTRAERFHYDSPYNHNKVIDAEGCRYSAPRLDQAQRWLREVKGIAINIIAHDGGEYHWSEVYLPNFKEEGYRWYDYREHPLMPSYEQALSAGLEAMLTLLTESHAD